MNFYILFLVSLPEAILNIVIILLFAGKKEKLNLNKPNLINFAVSLVAIMLVSNFLRPLAPNVMVNVLIHFLSYIVISFIIYKIKLTYSILSVSFMYLIYSTIENSYLPFIITYVCKGIENFFNNYYVLPIYTIPYRIGQFIVIVFLWKYEILLVSKINKLFHKLFILSSFILIYIEFFLGYLFCTYFEQIRLIHQLGLSVSLILLVFVLNLVIFKLIYITVSSLLINGYKKYSEFEEDVLFALDEIYLMLNDNRIDEAIELIKQLRGSTDIKK